MYVKIDSRNARGFEIFKRAKRRKKKVTFEDLLDTAIIHVGLKPSEFWNMTFVDYMRCVLAKAFDEAKEWERTRVMVALHYNINSKVKKSAEQIMPLWIDKLYKSKNRITEQEFKELIAKRNGRTSSSPNG